MSSLSEFTRRKPGSNHVSKSWKDWIGVELSAVSYKEKIVSAFGGFVSILALFLINEHVFMDVCPLIGSMGASAVLLFAVPHGQLSQPWPVMAGHVLSAFIGVTCARTISHPGLATAAAVCLSIGAMHQFKCIHPPGGATALIAVLGGPSVRALEFKFVMMPVFLNALAIVIIAIVFNALFAWRRYPAFLNHPASKREPVAAVFPPRHEDVMEALRSLDSFVDITEEDLVRLSQILRSQPGTKSAADKPSLSEG